LSAGAKRLGHRWVDRGQTRVCVNCSTLMEEVMDPTKGRMVKEYKLQRYAGEQPWTRERPECVFQ
jgi:hypothetical protein